MPQVDLSDTHVRLILDLLEGHRGALKARYEAELEDADQLHDLLIGHERAQLQLAKPRPAWGEMAKTAAQADPIEAEAKAIDRKLGGPAPRR